MQTLELGKTGLQVSRVVLGTMTFGSQVDSLEAASMIDLAFEHGVNFVDTANVYNLGEAERILGNLLHGRREKIVLATKVGNRMGDGPGQCGLSRTAIKQELDASLRRLKTDYIDLYYLHQPDPTVPIEESLETLEELRAAGKIRFIGASNYAAWQVCRMLCRAEINGWHAPTVVQPMYNLLARGIEQEFLPMCRELGVAVVVYNPLAGGLLTGKHRAEQLTPGTRFDRMPFYRDRYWHAANFDAVEALKEVAQAANRSLVSLSIGWLLERDRVDCLILGASRIAQLQENLAVFTDGPLSVEARDACEKVWNALRGVSPRYNR